MCSITDKGKLERCDQIQIIGQLERCDQIQISVN